MSKNKHGWKHPQKQDQPTSSSADDETTAEQLFEPDPIQDYLTEALICARSLNGIDHMRLCAYYVINRQQCDCGLTALRIALARYDEQLSSKANEHKRGS